MTAGARSENEAHPRRLQFGFAPELEKLVHDKVESSADLYVAVQIGQLSVFFKTDYCFLNKLTFRTSGTYMVEVEGEEHNKESTEERMVSVDLSKGTMLEIQITTGKTFAKHNLGKTFLTIQTSLNIHDP